MTPRREIEGAAPGGIGRVDRRDERGGRARDVDLRRREACGSEAERSHAGRDAGHTHDQETPPRAAAAFRHSNHLQSSSVAVDLAA